MPTIIGLFKRYEDADQAIRALDGAGVSRERLQFAARKHAVQRRLEIPSHGTRGDAGLGGLLAGLAPYSMMGVGHIFVTKAVSAAKSRTGLSLLCGGLCDVFSDWGVDKDEAQGYAGGVVRGGLVLAVHFESGEEATIRDIFRECKSLRTCTGKSCTGSLDTQLDQPTWVARWDEPELSAINSPSFLPASAAR